MASRFTFVPEAAHFPAANFAPLTMVATPRRYVLAFDAATDESAYWTAIAPQGLTGTMTAVIYYFMATANSAEIMMTVAVEAVTDADALDLDGAASFDTVNASAATTVPGTQGYLDTISITLTNNDSIAAGDYFRLLLSRDANNVGDDATGDAYVLAVEFRDGA